MRHIRTALFIGLGIAVGYWLAISRVDHAATPSGTTQQAPPPKNLVVGQGADTKSS